MTAPHQMMAWLGEEPKTERKTRLLPPTPRRLVPLKAVQWSSAASSQHWRSPGLSAHLFQPTGPLPCIFSLGPPRPLAASPFDCRRRRRRRTAR